MLTVLEIEMTASENSLEKHKQKYLKKKENFDQERAQHYERLEKILKSDGYIRQNECWQPNIFRVTGSYKEKPTEEPDQDGPSEEPTSVGSPELIVLEGPSGSLEEPASAGPSKKQGSNGSLDRSASACGSGEPALADSSETHVVAASSQEPAPRPSTPTSPTPFLQKEKTCFFCKGFHLGCDCLVITNPKRKRNRYEFDSSDDEETTHPQQPQGSRALARQPTVRNGWPASKIKKHLLDNLTEYQYDVLVNQALGNYGPKAIVQVEKQSVSDAEMALAMKDLELERRKKYKIPLKKNQNLVKEKENQSK